MAALSSDTSPLINDRYRVIQALGQGVTSWVYQVQDLHLDKILAMKLLRSSVDEDLLQAEFGQLSRLQHPNLVPVHDLNRVQREVELLGHIVPARTLYLVMDLVSGEHPQRWLSDLEPDQRDATLRDLARDLSRALEHVHDHGLVHHDVKPDNVLVERQEARARLMDLGLATPQLQGLPGRGTVPYLAPEALVGGGDHRVDLYSLGATLFQLCAGAPPFTGHGQQLLHQILQQQPELEVCWLSTPMRALILRLLHKDPLKRPPSARWVQAELARMAGDQGAVARLTSHRELLPPAFVGRARARGQLVQALNRPAGAHRPRVVLVCGEPGAGKSRLLNEALRQHRIQAAAEGHGTLELRSGSLKQVLTGLCLPPPVARWLNRRTDASRGGPSAVDRARSPADLALQILDALGNEDSTLGPDSVLHLPDAAADPVAMELIKVLLRAPDNDAPSCPLVLAEATTGSDLASLALNRAGDARPTGLLFVELKALSAGAIRQLVRSMVGKQDHDLARRVHELSQGNATLAVELIRQWHLQGEQGLDLDLAAGLDGLVARARKWLTPGQRKLMDSLAVWGEPATAEVLAALTRRSTAEVWAELEPLAVRGGEVVLHAGRARFSSAARTRAWQRACEHGPAALHRRAAKLLEQPGGGDLSRLAWHHLRGEMNGASALALRAGEQLAAAMEPRRAMELLQEVVRRDSGTQRQRAVPLLAELLTRLGLYDEALGLLDRHADGGEPLVLARAQALQLKGDYAEAEQALQLALPQLEQHLRPQAEALLGRLMLRTGRSEQALELVGGDADELAQRAEPAVAAELLEVAGLARLYLGQLERAELLFARGEQLLGSQGAAGRRARLVNLRGMVAFTAGWLEPAERHYRRAAELFAEAGEVHGQVLNLFNLASVLSNRGRYGEALAGFTAATRDLQRLASTAQLASAQCNMANLLLQLGDVEHVAPVLRQAWRLTRQLGSRQVEAYLEMVEGDLSRRRQDLPGAAERYGRAAKVFLQVGDRRTAVLAVLSRAEVLAAAGHPDQAAALVAELQPQADQQGHLALSHARVSLALDAAADLPRELVDQLAAHCARLEQQGAARELWRAAALLGRVLAAKGEGGMAHAALQRAHQTWEEIMANAPDVYHEGMTETDPEARSLASQWAALLDASPGPAQEASPPAAGPRPGDARLRRLLAINKRLNSEHRLPHLLEYILDAVIELTGAERGFLLLVEDDGSLSIKVARNIDQHSLQGEELSLSRSIAERAASAGEPVITVDAAEDGRFAEAVSVSHLRLRSVLAAPLVVKGRTVGTVYLDHRLRQGVFTEVEVNLVQDLADQAAIAIENARLLADNRRRHEEIGRLNHRLRAQVESQQVELQEVREELRSSRSALQLQYDYRNIIGRTPRMMELFRLLDRVTETELPVVVQGDSGTGKELVARAIHINGARKAGPFVSENCGAIPETLLESVLFGHVKGAFTGADRERKGLFEVANGGSLFLDEVGEMSAAMQTKLLRVLQNGEYRPVGGTDTRVTDVRIIAASNKDLSQLVASGVFREDLFYRLNVILIQIPPLRDRREDIPLLVDHFLSKHAAQGRRVGTAAMAALMGHAWPGNVRELENEVMRAAALGGEVILVDDLSPQVGSGAPLALADPDDLDLRNRVEHLERDMISRALERTGGNNTHAAQLLGLSRYGLLKKLKRLEMAGYSPK